jgi:NADPH:quinone reductase-like Zn-dependent oxidoreductase
MLLSPVNPSDLNFVHGTYHAALERVIWNQRRPDGDNRVYYDPPRTNPCPTPPYALGGEGVGIVDACGSGFLARRLRGQRVAIAGGPPNGTWQEYTLADAKRAVVVPESVPDEQAAMFFVNPITAYVLVREVLRVRRGEWVLVTAAGSALGKSVVRLGRRDGFRTICVVRSGANSAELAALGADAVVETDRQDPVAEVARITGDRGVPHALDCVGGELAGLVVRCLGLGGRLVIYGTLGNSPLQIPGRDLMMPAAQVSGFLLPVWMAQQSPLKLLGMLRAVRRLTVEGLFRTEVRETYPLEQVQAAIAASLAPGRTGKVMLRLGERTPTDHLRQTTSFAECLRQWIGITTGRQSGGGCTEAEAPETTVGTEIANWLPKSRRALPEIVLATSPTRSQRFSCDTLLSFIFINSTVSMPRGAVK